MYSSRTVPARDLSLLGVKVIDEPHLDPLVPLGDDNVARVPPLPVDFLEPPDLGGRPAAVEALDVADDELGLRRLPPLLEVLVGDLVLGGDPPGPALDVAEQPVAVLAEGVVEGAVLGGALDAARRRLLDVHVRQPGLVDVLLDVQRHRRQADGLARQPAHALQRQGWVGRVGQGLVLVAGLAAGLVDPKGRLRGEREEGRKG